MQHFHIALTSNEKALAYKALIRDDFFSVALSALQDKADGMGAKLIESACEAAGHFAIAQKVREQREAFQKRHVEAILCRYA